MSRKFSVIKYFTLFLLLLVSCVLKAQQSEQQSQFVFNKYANNPAYGGLERSLSVTGIYRTQWDQVDGNPSHVGINAHMPVYLLQGSFGIKILNENIGLETNTSLSLSYNTVKQLDFGLLSAGLGIGIVQKSIDLSRAETPLGIYTGGINHNDPLLAENGIQGFAPLWEFGLYFSNDWFETGLSIQNLPAHNIKVDDLNAKIQPSYKLYFEYKGFNPVQNVQIKPVVQIQSNNQEIQLVTAAIMDYGNIFGGIGIRGYNQKSIEGLIFIMGLRIDKNYKISYSYDYGLNSLRRVSDGSHEFILNYNLQKLIGIGLDPPVIYNPRHL